MINKNQYGLTKNSFFELTEMLLVKDPKNIIMQIQDWKKLQSIILEKIMELYSEKKTSKIGVFNSLHRAIDSIVWNLVNKEIADIRRLYIDPPTTKNPVFHNIYFHKEIAELINTNQESIGIISDITSGVDLGDVVFFSVASGLFQPFECKEGEINKIITDAIKLKRKGDVKLYDEIMSDKNSKKAKQLARCERQFTKIELEMEKYINGGNEYVSNEYGIILKDTREIEYYNIDVQECIIDAIKNNFSKKDIPGGVRIIALKNELINRDLSLDFFKKHVEGFCDVEYITVYDLKEYLFGTNFSMPLYIQDISLEEKWVLYSGEVTVYIIFSLLKFSELLEKEGFHCQLIKGRNLQKEIHSSTRSYPPCVIGKSMLRFSIDDSMIQEFAQGKIYRLIGQFETPLSIIDMIKKTTLSFAKDMIKKILVNFRPPV